MKNLKSRAAVILLISVMCFAQILSILPETSAVIAPALKFFKPYGAEGGDLSIAYSLVASSGGGFVTAGYTSSIEGEVYLPYDFWLCSMDSDGNRLWEKTYGGTNNEIAFSVVQTSDGGYALAGRTQSFGEGSDNAWLVKTDASGNEQWSKAYGSGWEEARSVVQTSDGGYALAGYTDLGDGNYDAFLVKTDANGDEQWSRTYGGTQEDTVFSMVQTSDGGYALAGHTESFGVGSFDAWLVKTDANGDEQWSKTYGGSGYDGAWSVVQTVDGGYALAGWLGTTGTGAWLVKTDASGVEQWNQVYGAATQADAFSVIQTRDGSFALAGSAVSSSTSGRDFYWVKTDASGVMTAGMTVGGGLYIDEIATSVVQTIDGGYALAGMADATDAGGSYQAVIMALGPEHYTLTTTADPSKGSVSRDPDDEGQGYVYDSSVSLTAWPNDGYRFDCWSGDLAGSENPTTFNIGGDMKVFANFVDSANLLENPGFESAVEGEPTGWSVAWPGGDGSFSYTVVDSDVTPPHSGYSSCMGHEDYAGDLGRLFQDVTGVTTPGNAYQISGWIKTVDMIAGSVIIGLDYVDGTGATPEDGYVKEIGHVAASDQGWTYFQSDVFTLPPMPYDVGEGALWFLLDFNEGAGTAFFDDVSLIQVTAAASLTVSNVVYAPPTGPDVTEWSYQLGQGETVVESFSLPVAGGGSVTIPDLTQGFYWLEQTTKYGYDTTVKLNGIDIPVQGYNTVVSTTINLGAGPNSVEFTNKPYSAEGKAGGGGSTQSTIYNVPCWVAVPVQASFDPGFKSPDWSMGLVKDKPMAILVNLTDALLPKGTISPTDTTPITISISCPGLYPNNNPSSLSATTTGKGINTNNITIIAAGPPSVLGSHELTCTVTYGFDPTPIHTPETTTVTVKETSPLSLYYVPLSRTADYGSSIDSVNTMIQNTRDFVGAVYPTSSVAVDQNTTVTIGQATTAGPPLNDRNIAMLLDCQFAEQQAKLAFPNSPNAIGIAIGPYQTAQKNYFKYHGAVSSGKTAVGISFGTGVKGVVVMDGYYSAVAHEIGHTFGLYYPPLQEEYATFNPGIRTNGFSPAENKWRSGTDFMGLSPLGSTDTVWVDTAGTFNPVLAKLKTPNDPPQILLVNGIIFKEDDSVMLPYTWYSVPYGTPDAVSTPTGRFGLRFTTGTGTVETRFDAQFYMNVDPGIALGQDLPTDFTEFGAIPTNFAGFAFAVEYPVGTTKIELIDHTPPPGQNEVIKTISPESVVSTVVFGGFLPPINPDGSSIFKLGSTVPVKFQLKDLQGKFITDAKATISTAKVANNVIGTDVEAVSTSAATTGNLFRYDPTANQYIFNLSTKSMTKGTYQIKVTIDDAIIKTVNISLR